MCLPFPARLKIRCECTCSRILQYNHPGSERSRERNQIVVAKQFENHPIFPVQSSCILSSVKMFSLYFRDNYNYAGNSRQEKIKRG